MRAPRPAPRAAGRGFRGHKARVRLAPGWTDVFAVGVQQGGIDPVQRGAAHQAHDFLDVRSFVLLPACFQPSSLYHGLPPRSSSRNSCAPLWRAGPITIVPAPEELDALFQSERVTAYIGFDCTAKSMHIGNLVQLMTLRRLQQAGHRPILLMGGGTTKAGDPSGKDETRLILSPEQIEDNKQQHAERRAASAEIRRRPVRRHHGRQCANGWTGWNTFPSCARSAGISRSTAC